MAPVSTKVEIVLNDWSNEKTSVVFHFPPVEDDGSNWDTLFTTPLLSNLAIMQTALDAITLLDHWYTIAHCQVKESSKTTPSDQHAQREYVIVWTYADSVTGRLGRFSTPGPEDDLTKPNSDDIDMTNATVIAFKAAIDANCLSRVGNPISIVKGKVNGRRD